MESYARQHFNVGNPSSDYLIERSLTIYSLTEMFVGIICACVPSAAHSCREHVPAYTIFKNYLHSRFSTLHSIFRDTTHKSYQRSHSAPETKAHGSYSNIDPLWGSEKVGMPQRDTGIRTFIRGGPQNKKTKNGIHVGSEIETNSHLCDKSIGSECHLPIQGQDSESWV